MKCFIYIAVSLGVMIGAGTGFGANYGVLGGEGLQVAGDASFTFRMLDMQSVPNQNFRLDDPFNLVRVRTFLMKQWNPKDEITVEFLWDQRAAPRVQGAYLTFRDFWGPLGARVGMIPSPFGNYGTRSTYFNQNPVIGVPAMWHYRTPLRGNGATNNSSLFEGGRARNRVNRGVPMAYDACWDYGIELFLYVGMWEFTVAGTESSISSMGSWQNSGKQGILKLSLHPSEGLRCGVSGAYNSWMAPDTSVHLPENINSYVQQAASEHVEYSIGHWQFFHEAMWTNWESPFIHEEYLENYSGYLEGRWTFLPGWYLGGRYDFFLYNEISTTNDGLGPKKTWGYDFDRIEAALGYRVIREGFIRLDYQGTYFRDAGVDPLHLGALQFLFAF